ncbi:histidine phosphatase family protein [Corallococcus llansteffanensis]|uniref:Histidine phosphatase family protein n=1 Tax=Corallococcus llansteffanensis TaxID=2316731 RepID=A0A3A8QHM1_9BACT|nr:histidine phosphatase family protein [Corallococcus llansteffanensis]RKH65785.1 histidine phosphatase family protein [Corallococcus llansteffanensis]
MKTRAPQVVLVRHGETEWSRSSQHTGRTDLPLLEDGRKMGAQLGAPLRAWSFAAVWSSPLARALETCVLAGYGDVVQKRDDLMEFDYGDYEGRTGADIRTTRPGWTLWRDGVPNGETLEQVAARVDRVIADARALQDDVLLFAHGHVLRILAARWLGLPPDGGRLFHLDTASISVLSSEAGGAQPVLVSWNDTTHLKG